MWLHFRMDGTVDQEVSYQALQRAASGRRVRPQAEPPFGPSPARCTDYISG